MDDGFTSFNHILAVFLEKLKESYPDEPRLQPMAGMLAAIAPVQPRLPWESSREMFKKYSRDIESDDPKEREACVQAVDATLPGVLGHWQRSTPEARDALWQYLRVLGRLSLALGYIEDGEQGQAVFFCAAGGTKP